MASPRPPATSGLSLPMPSAPSSCPCGSGASLARCCGPVHADHAQAKTAEQLMRARYSAFSLRRRRFIEASWHPSTRPERVGLDDDTEWLGLTITKVVSGGPSDQYGEVAFTARLRDGDEQRQGEQQLVEHSRFERVDGRWFYVDAIT